MVAKHIELESLEDDGLVAPEVGVWAEEKYRLVTLYANLFAKSMSGKWESLVYIDLFSGSGRARIRGSDRLVASSPTIAMSVESGFNQFIFCDQDRDALSALELRASRDFPAKKAAFIHGDVNENIERVLSEIPGYSRHHRVLTLCFVDPYSMPNLKFSTIQRLAERFIDFLILIPTGYDATRNEQLYYTDESSTVVGDFLGMPDWRSAWEEASARGESFEIFITNALAASMEKLDFHFGGETHPVKLPGKNVRLYRLALFSRHGLGEKFWQQSKKYAIAQQSLF